jgi:serine kinase of HPr protein (carbohydrate metabolism regulator)
VTAILVHGTAIAVGTTGILIVGRSGAGKTELALSLLSAARRAGHFAALVSDDQVYTEAAHGRIIATPPAAIRGKIEVRGTGIGTQPVIDAAVIALVLEPVQLTSANRIPEENQYWESPQGVRLPKLFLDRQHAVPFEALSSVLPGFPAQAQVRG